MAINLNKISKRVAALLADENFDQLGIRTNALFVQQAAATAFGESLVGELHPLFQGSFEYTVQNTDLVSNTTVDGGTVTQASGMGVLSTSTTTASSALLESKQHARYKSGLGGVDRFTALFTTPVAATEQYIGLADETGSSATFKNGYMVGYDGVTFGFHRFQNDTKISIDLADWDDPLGEGGVLGASGITLDQTKLNVFYIQYQYLGGGPIRIFLMSDLTGYPVLVHTVLYNNSNTEPSTHNPNFHHTMWVANKGTTSNMILKSSSYGYFVEGRTKHIELHQPTNSSDLITANTVTSEIPILTIRNKSSYVSKTNFIDIELKHVTVAIEANSANNLGSVRMIRNATLTGASYSDINTTNSVIDIDVAAGTVTGGTAFLPLPLAGKNDSISESLDHLELILNPGETMTIAGKSANDATMEAEILWRELF